MATVGTNFLRLFLALYTAESRDAAGLQVLAGVLVKYVNFGKGWRHRLFVLQDGVLRYYKVWAFSTTLVNKICSTIARRAA